MALMDNQKIVPLQVAASSPAKYCNSQLEAKKIKPTQFTAVILALAYSLERQ